MNLQQLKEIIINEIKPYIIDKGDSSYLYNDNKNLFIKLNNKYNNCFCKINELLYLNKNYDNLENLHIFCECGNKNNFINISLGYHKNCCISCSMLNIDNKIYRKSHYKQILEKTKQTNLKKYGVESVLQAKIVKDKIKQTMLNDIDKNGLNKYQRAARKGVKTKRNDIDENGLNCYQRANIKAINIMKNIIDKNGISLYQKTKLKCKQTILNNIDKNGLNGYQQIAKKTKNTMLSNINENGLNGYQQARIKQFKTMRSDIDKNGLNKLQLARIKQYNTMLNNIDKNGLNGIEKRIIKSFNTMKKNNSFTKSKSEEQIYNYLLQKFNKEDIIRQYKSNLYPFHSDFYIKSLDLYIEYHGTWTHSPFNNNHRKPFKNSVEDIKILEKLKNKNSKYYNNAIYIWTNLDVRKLNTFKKNKLNYKIFYSIEQFLNWYNKI